MMMNGTMMDWHMTPWHWLFMLIFWIVVIAALVLFVRWVVARTKPGGGSPEKSPLDIAKERYARGEITREEFERMKKDLE